MKITPVAEMQQGLFCGCEYCCFFQDKLCLDREINVN